MIHLNLAAHNWPVPFDESWNVLDSTKLESYKWCPRRFFFNHILGLSLDIPSLQHHLEFGRMFHEGMEVLYREWHSPDAPVQAFEAFFESWKQTYPNVDATEMDALGFKAKTPGNAFRAFAQYRGHYDSDEFEILWQEIGGWLLVSEGGRMLWFKTDTVLRTPDGVEAREFKTTSRMGADWSKEFQQRLQMGTYYAALETLPLPEGEESVGVVVDGICIRSEPRLKKNGEPYAGALDNEFQRYRYRKTLDQQEEWLDRVNYWIDLIEADMERLQTPAATEGSVLRAFRKNDNSCTTKYGTCPFLDLCMSRPNPLRFDPECVPVGYKRSFWDPRKETKHKIEGASQCQQST